MQINGEQDEGEKEKDKEKKKQKGKEKGKDKEEKIREHTSSGVNKHQHTPLGLFLGDQLAGAEELWTDSVIVPDMRDGLGIWQWRVQARHLRPEGLCVRALKVREEALDIIHRPRGGFRGGLGDRRGGVGVECHGYVAGGGGVVEM